MLACRATLGRRSRAGRHSGAGRGCREPATSSDHDDHDQWESADKGLPAIWKPSLILLFLRRNAPSTPSGWGKEASRGEGIIVFPRSGHATTRHAGFPAPFCLFVTLRNSCMKDCFRGFQRGLCKGEISTIGVMRAPIAIIKSL